MASFAKMNMALISTGFTLTGESFQMNASSKQVEQKTEKKKLSLAERRAKILAKREQKKQKEIQAIQDLRIKSGLECDKNPTGTVAELQKKLEADLKKKQLKKTQEIRDCKIWQLESENLDTNRWWGTKVHGWSEDAWDAAEKEIVKDFVREADAAGLDPEQILLSANRAGEDQVLYSNFVNDSSDFQTSYGVGPRLEIYWQVVKPSSVQEVLSAKRDRQNEKRKQNLMSCFLRLLQFVLLIVLPLSALPADSTWVTSGIIFCFTWSLWYCAIAQCLPLHMRRSY